MRRPGRKKGKAPTKPAAIVARIAESIAAYRLIAPGQAVLVALSGGPDSVALLHILGRLRPKLGISVGAIYINHRLRPRAAAAEARFCEELCLKLKIRFYHEEVDIPAMAAREKSGIEEAARRHRYRILEQLAQSEGYDKVALGHHRDDRVETILFNLIRGAGRHGLAGMPRQRGRFIRPLYDVSREEILAYLKSHHLSYMTDRSNSSREYTRNRIRHDILPRLEQAVSGRAAEHIIRLAEIIGDEEAFLSQQAARVYQKLVARTPGGKLMLDLTGAERYDKWLRRRLIIFLLDEAGLTGAEFAEVERMVALFDITSMARMSLRDGAMAERSGKTLFVYRSERIRSQEELPVPGKVRLEYPRVRIVAKRAKAADASRVMKASSRVAYVDAARLDGPLHVAGVKPGAKFHPFGRPGTKKVGDFLTDRKYPRPLRDELPVVYDRQGIVWLVGIEIDHRVCIDMQTKEAVKLEVHRY